MIKIDNHAWHTLFEHSFNDSQYIYHYTNVNKAIKILNTNSLRFAPLSKTNDTMESKPKIKILNVEDSKEIKKMKEYFINLNVRSLQLLCFTMDYPKMDNIEVNEIDKYSNYSGRGFALPRMWSQYANDNSGVCFVFNKKKLKDIIYDQYSPIIILDGKVDYYDQFSAFSIEYNKIKLLLQFEEKYGNGIGNAFFNMNFFQENVDFIRYNYFSKLKDWEGEREYRFLLYGDKEYYVNDISSAISGVIIGEKIEEEYEEIISYFCDDVCEVKKITFACNECGLVNIFP